MVLGVGCRVLTYAAPTDRWDLVEAVVSAQGLLLEMADQRNGFATTQRLFKVSTGHLLQEAHRQLKAESRRIESTKHGQALLDILARESPPEDALGRLVISKAATREQGPATRYVGL